jgi:hypothetical protein
MAARKRPTPEDAVTARRILLDGLARDADISGLMAELAPLHPRNDTFPGEIFLRLAADALDWCGASREQPLTLEGIRERYLPECTVRGRQNKKLQYAILAAAALHGGAEPDLLDEVAWWQTDDFWQYAIYAAIATSAPPPTAPECRRAWHARNSPSARPGRPADPLVHDLQFRQQKDPICAVTGSAHPGHTADQNGGSARVSQRSHHHCARRGRMLQPRRTFTTSPAT